MSAPSTADLADHLVRTANADPSSANLLAQLVSDRMRYTGAGSPPVVLDGQGRPALDPSGVPVTPAALIAGFAAEMPQLFRSKSPAPSAPASNPHGVIGATAKALAEYQAAQQSQGSEDHGNPFKKGPGWNLTRQVMMRSRDPKLAARLEAEAGA